MKKEVRKKIVSSRTDNSFGVSSVIFGILSITFAGIYGIPFGIIGFIFSNKQNVVSENKWSRAGKILSVIGLIVSIIFSILIVWLSNNPQYLASLGQS